MRLLPRATPKTVHAGDVVAFRSPLTVAAAAGAGVGGLGGFAAAALEPELLQVCSADVACDCWLVALEPELLQVCSGCRVDACCAAGWSAVQLAGGLHEVGCCWAATP